VQFPCALRTSRERRAARSVVGDPPLGTRMRPGSSATELCESAKRTQIEWRDENQQNEANGDEPGGLSRQNEPT